MPAGREAVDLVVCDLAGTSLVDDGQVPAAFAATLAEIGLELTADMLHRVRGSSKREALAALIPAGPEHARRVDDATARFRALLERQYRERPARPMPGAEATFDRLRDRGIRLALATGFDRDTTRLLLDSVGWSAGRADAVVCADDVSRGRPAPYLIFRAMEATGALDVRRVCAVGDTALDLHAGWNAGVGWNVGVLSGAHDHQTLAAAPHTHLIPGLAELPQVWERGGRLGAGTNQGYVTGASSTTE